MDLKEYFRETEARASARSARRSARPMRWWERLRWYQKATIAMVNGWCFGGGYGPLFACDLAFCADEAQFGLSEINWGILPGGGATKVAVELMPHAQGDVPRADRREPDRQAGRRAAGWSTNRCRWQQLEARVSEVARTCSRRIRQRSRPPRMPCAACAR